MLCLIDINTGKMTKLMLKIVHIWFLLFSKFDFTASVQHELDTSNIMVGFNPYVSVLDQYNYSRYGISELIPLIEKVATRFRKIHINLNLEYFKKKSRRDKNETPESLLLSPLAVGKYNCLPTTINKIEVFLETDNYFIGKGCDCDKFFQKLHPVLSLAERANTLCSKTVSTILVEKYCTNTSCSLLDSRTTKLQEALKFRLNYAWGVSVHYKYYQDIDMSDHSQFSSVDVLKVTFRNRDEYFEPNNTAFKFYNYNNGTKKALKVIKKLVSSGFNDLNNIENLTDLVSTWKDILTQPSDIYFLTFAFDNYYDYFRLFGTGWWYLLNDPGSTNTTKFGFEEVIKVASRVDDEENPRNYKWLKKNQKFNKNTTAIISYSITELQFPEYYNFCRIMAVEPFNISELELVLKQTEKQTGVKSCQSSRHVYLLPFLNLNETYVRSSFSVYSILEAERKMSRGYAYPLFKCATYSDSKKEFNELKDQLLDRNNKVILFHFSVDYNSINQGTRRSFRQRIVMFEKCREIVRSFGRTDVEIAFVSLGYIKVKNFHSSVEAMQEYVKYIYLLSDWAEKQNNVVVGLGILEDKTLKVKTRFGYRNISYVGLYTENNFSHVYTAWSTKALELSQLRFPEPIKNDTINENIAIFDTSQFFIMFSILALVIVIICLLAIYLICRYYKNNYLSKTECKQFFKGEKSDCPIKMSSYDKEKYEIGKGKFRVELDTPLGSGEFGAAYQGIIETLSGEIKVAVKTSNPEKYHKTQITGLLSEIKVLAYIGKHSNIIELLGANTEDLKKGIVYIFLEFCHLGSLKKTLNDMRLLMRSPVLETNVDTVKYRNSYVNLGAENGVILDAALSQDLYRWSTEICNGMEFLAEKHVVHGDLATRNVLLNLRREAKICDFGLSRRMYNYTNYVKKQHEPLPWKWMAPEALRDMQFNEKTDVWAYGVTLWEIYSLGSTPYGGLAPDPNFSQILEQGKQLSEPEYCERDMYAMMQKCWIICPEHRPTFAEILSLLQLSNNDLSTEQ